MYIYLGIRVENKGMEKERNERRVKVERKYGIINTQTKFRANKYETVRGLWKGAAGWNRNIFHLRL